MGVSNLGEYSSGQALLWASALRLETSDLALRTVASAIRTLDFAFRTLDSAFRTADSAFRTPDSGPLTRDRSFPSPNGEPDGSPFESKLLPQLIHQIPLIRKVEFRGHVREQDERRRFDAGLDAVKDADVPARLAGRRVGGRDALEELVEFRRGDPLLPRGRHAIHHFQQLPGAVAGQRREPDDRRVLEELELKAQLVVELLGEILAAALHQIPFVHCDDDAGAGFFGF